MAVEEISITNDRYSQLLQEIRIEHLELYRNIKRFVNSAKYKIEALANELKLRVNQDGTKLSFKDIREKLYADCSEFWERDTIRKSFPDWLRQDYNTPEVDELIAPVGFVQYGNSGMMIPEDQKKYFSEEIEKNILVFKRTFRQLIKESEGSDDIQKAFSDYCYAAKALQNVKWYIENIGRQYKMRLIDPTTDEGKQLRKPISVYNLNFPLYDDMKKYADSIREKKELYVKQLDNYIDSLYRYPICDIEDFRYMDMCWTSLLIDSYQAINLKSSQTLEEMFETEKLSQTMTDKQAGKNSSTKTLVCKSCLKKFDAEKNHDPPIAEIDRGSPTGFRCSTCLGIEMCERGLTKDIVIQRKPFLEKVSYHMEKYPPMGVFTTFGNSIKKVLVGTRKTLASGMLQQNSFGSSNNPFSKL